MHSCWGVVKDRINVKGEQYMTKYVWASMQETLSFGLANNNSADQPAQPCSLISFCYSLIGISVFVIPLLESIIYKLATREILIF